MTFFVNLFSQFLLLCVSSDQKLLLTKACEDLEQENQQREEEKVRYLGEKIPALQVSKMSMEELQVGPQVTGSFRGGRV